MNQTQKKVKAILRSIAGMMTDDDMDFVTELNEAGEWGVAIEHLCVQLDEYEVRLSVSQIRQIQDACESCGVDSRYWKYLEDNALDG